MSGAQSGMSLDSPSGGASGLPSAEIAEQDDAVIDLRKPMHQRAG